MKVKFSLFLLVTFVFCFSCETTDQAIPSTVAPAAVTPANPAKKPASTEYSRAVATLSTAVSEDTFLKDKEEIMKIISELEQAMKSKNVTTWRKYLSPSSVAYLKNPQNLKSVSTRLPAQINLRTDEDYFKYVFIPSRQGRTINEIRYLSPSITKAVQVRETDDVIYYYFEKISGKWLVKLDEMQN